MKKKLKEFMKINQKNFLIILSIIGFVLTLIYIFYTSTAILTSDSVITDVLAHEQKINHQFFLEHWYYGNEFWFFSPSIPILILSFFSSNQILIRHLTVVLTAIAFFILLYQYGKKMLKKEDCLLLIAIFASGISYSILDYFYAFNVYLTVVINSLFLLFLYYQCFEEKNKKKLYFPLALIVTFLLNMASLRYIPMIIVPFIITELIFIIQKNLNSNIFKLLKNTKIKKLIIIIIITIISFLVYQTLTRTLHFDARASNMDYVSIESENIRKGGQALIDAIANFFGFDNKDHPITFMMVSDYFLPQQKDFSLVSPRGIAYLIKFIICILMMVIAPIYLWKHYKEHDRKIQFLLLFNTISWGMLIYSYLFLKGFFYHYHELKYFLTNIIINIILAIYCISKFWCKNKIPKYCFQILLIGYIVSNIYTTTSTIMEHDQEIMDRRYELTETLEKHQLTFGYADFWDGLLTYYLSNYQITVAGVNFEDRIVINPWYADERWYERKYHLGKTFLALNSKGELYKEFYIRRYGKPDKIITTKHYQIYVYNQNPFYDLPSKKVRN